jgi:penicillin amidase
MRRLLPIALLTALSCKPDPEPPPAPSPLLDVPAAATWTIPGMTGKAQVIRNPQGIPWVYAENRGDLGRALGFVLARDRYFYMDLARRLSQGRVAELLGADALETDIESRMTAMTWIGDHLGALIRNDPEMSAYFAGVAEGVNAHVAAVQAGQLPPPTEYGLAAGLLGTTPEALMTPFSLEDVVAGMVTVLYESGFETKDVGRSADAERLATHFAGADLADLRQAGLDEDVWNRAEPVQDVAVVPDWAERGPGVREGASPRRATHTGVAPGVLSRLHAHTQRIEDRLHHDWQHGFGSNAWAVSGAASADGRAMIATDGHLDLSIPPLFYQVGIDTQHLGGGDIHQVGMMTPAMPLMSTGTNGDIAFGQTQLFGDITDWYAEELQLDDAGAPKASKFQGAWRDLLPTPESFEVANIPVLGSVGGTTLLTRYTTFDGRWITSVEGTAVAGPEAAGPGQTAINLLGDWVIPSDVDGDGRITAVSFDYAGLDLSNMAATIDRYNRASDVTSFAEATRDLVAYSLNLVAADKEGRILYTAFQATPCRDYLERDAESVWTEGSDPNLLLDGTRYGGFRIPLTADGRVDTAPGATDPYACVIPWEETPHAFDPDQGFLVTANNDPGGITFDGSLTNDVRYIGGPWMEGYRAQEITEELAALDGAATLADMQRIQADHTSVIGKQLGPELLASIDAVRAWSQQDRLLAPDEQRAVDAYVANTAAVEDAYSRLNAWAQRGFEAESGVETFYHSPSAEAVQDSIATSIFNAWMGRYVARTVNDENIPGLGWPTGDTGRFRLLTRMLEGRGAANPLAMGSWNPALNESAYFDDLRTPGVIESSTEDAMLSLVEGLAFLASPPVGPGVGGFGTDDPERWTWGLRHWVAFESLLGGFFDTSDPLLGAIVAPLEITPDDFPVAEGLTEDDPRFEMPGFPRWSDNLNVDAGNSGTNGSTFNYGAGPVWRLVVALGGSGFEAWNVLPGGQSGLSDSPNFSDQAKLWLGNQALPVPLYPDDVAAQPGATREVFTAP